MMSRFQRVLRSLHLMFTPYKPSKRPTFLTDDELEIRRAVARDLMGDVQPKGRFGPREVGRAGPKAVDFDGLPNG